MSDVGNKEGARSSSTAVMGGDNDNNITQSATREEDEGYGGYKGEVSQASKARAV
jgi:hypothetical protein